jgi:nucleotide-binding universal stress UspA family protein
MPITMSSVHFPELPLRLEFSGRVVLLATDGAEGSAGALHVALALADEHAAVIHVVHVVDTRAAPIPGPLDLLVALGDELTGPAVHEEQVRELRAALSLQVGRDIDWPVAFLIGNPASTIVNEARRIGAALIVVGLRRHGKVDRAINDETAHRVMQHAECPVLGIVPATTALPTHVLVALDFSRTSLLAAHAARAVAGHDARVSLVYVAPPTIALSDDGEVMLHKLGLEAAFARTLVDLADDIRFDHVVLHREPPRDPAEIVLEYAETIGSDLIAAGSARHGRIERWFLGSVSSAIVHDGRRSVLIVPAPRDTQ